MTAAQDETGATGQRGGRTVQDGSVTMTAPLTRAEWRDRYDTMTTLHTQLAPEQIASVMLDWYGACPDAPDNNNNVRWMNSRAICGVLNEVAPNWTDLGDTEGSAVSAIRALATERDGWRDMTNEVRADFDAAVNSRNAGIFEVLNARNRAAITRCAELARGLADCSARLYATETPVIGTCVVIPGNALIKTWTHQDFTQKERENWAERHANEYGGTAYALLRGAKLTERAP